MARTAWAAGITCARAFQIGMCAAASLKQASQKSDSNCFAQFHTSPFYLVCAKILPTYGKVNCPLYIIFAY
jgi:hypothetical protein